MVEGTVSTKREQYVKSSRHDEKLERSGRMTGDAEGKARSRSSRAGDPPYARVWILRAVADPEGF